MDGYGRSSRLGSDSSTRRPSSSSGRRRHSTTRLSSLSRPRARSISEFTPDANHANVEIRPLWARLYTEIPGSVRDPRQHGGRRWPLRTPKSTVSRETSRHIRPSSPMWMGSTPPLAHIREPDWLGSSVFNVKLPRDSDAAGPCRSCGRRELEAGLVPR